MAWWHWRNKTVTARDADFWTAYYGSENWAGEPVTPQSAMQLSAFFACVRLIAQTIATLPLGVFERNEKGEKTARPDHPLYRLLHDSPNADQTAVEFWEGRILGLCTSGNGYAEKKLSGKRLISLEPMPADTAVKRLESGALQYSYYDRGKEIKLPEERVFHIRGFGDSDCGISPVAVARQTLGLAVATDKAAAQTFSRGLRTKGFFTFPGTLTPEQRAQAQKNFADRYSAPNAPGVGILEAAVDFKPVNISPRDAELIMSRRFNVEDVCRWLGVPPILIGHAADGQTMWGSGIEQIMLGWLTLGLRPYLTRIEQAVKKRLILPEERGTIFAEFNIEGLLRADSAGRAALYSSFGQNGIMTRNEMRGKENLPAMAGGDVLTVQSNLVPLDQLGVASASAAGEQVRNSLIAWLAVPERLAPPDPKKETA